MQRAERPIVKATLNLFEGQTEKLREYYPDIGASAAIRRMIDAYLEKIELQGGNLNVDVEIKI
jgi:hypothetical protein